MAPCSGASNPATLFFTVTPPRETACSRPCECLRRCQAHAGLDELTQEIQVYPQRLVNVRIKGRKRLEDLPGGSPRSVRPRILGDSGRVLVRFSGTEPLARVMVEGPELERVEDFANRIAAQIQAELGS